MRILINGASRGIGGALAKHFQELHDVVGTSRKLHPPFGVDSEDEVEVEKFFKKYVSDVDVLINCAGCIHISRIESENRILKTIGVNLIGYWNFVQNVLPGMQKQKSGYIINISSIRSTIPGEGKAAYSISKAGVDALTRAINLENFEKFGIRATSICPDTVDTTMGRMLEPDKKIIAPENIAKTVEWLLSLDRNVLIPEVKMTWRYPVV